MTALDPHAFPVERAEVRPGVELAFVRANPGGSPLLLVHGWPETMRIWWRNVGPLAEAGFEVVVPDLRGFGRSGLAPDGAYDLAAHARDLEALVRGTLGHEVCAAVGGDLGSAIVVDLALRFPGLVERACVFNGPLPLLPDAYAAAGIDPAVPDRVRMAADYFVRQGRDADALAAELRTPEARRAYVAAFYGSRFWAAPGTFSREDVAFMTEPFGDAARLRASFGNYEAAVGTRPSSEPPHFLEPCPVETLVLYGPEDHVVHPRYPEMAAVAFPAAVGPFVVPGAGHFLQWERADVLNRALVSVLRDRLPPGRSIGGHGTVG